MIVMIFILLRDRDGNEVEVAENRKGTTNVLLQGGYSIVSRRAEEEAPVGEQGEGSATDENDHGSAGADGDDGGGEEGSGEDAGGEPSEDSGKEAPPPAEKKTGKGNASK